MPFVISLFRKFATRESIPTSGYKVAFRAFSKHEGQGSGVSQWLNSEPIV